jgi:hypothetical protein
VQDIFSPKPDQPDYNYNFPQNSDMELNEPGVDTSFTSGRLGQLFKKPDPWAHESPHKPAKVRDLCANLDSQNRELLKEKNQSNIVNLAEKREFDEFTRRKNELESKILTLEETCTVYDKKSLPELENQFDNALRKQEALYKENSYLQEKLGKFGQKIKEKISTQSAEIEGNHLRIEIQREAFFFSKNEIDQECDQIFQEMLRDFEGNEQLLKSNIDQLDQEIAAKKSNISEIKNQFEKLRHELSLGLKDAEEKIRREEYDRHLQKNDEIQEATRINSEEIREKANLNRALDSRINQQKAINRRFLDSTSNENRTFKNAKDVAINEFKNVESMITKNSEKAQSTRNEIFKCEEILDSLRNIEADRQYEYDKVANSMITENQTDIR